jgi:hypothetical protein
VHEVESQYFGFNLTLCTMKWLAIERLEATMPRFLNLSSDELEARIDLLYSLGYVYDPYLKIFFNPFISQVLKAQYVYLNSQASIEKFHNLVEKDFLKKNQEYVRLDKIAKSFHLNHKIELIVLFSESFSGLIGGLLFLISVVTLIAVGATPALWTGIGAFIAINFYVLRNALYGLILGDFLLSNLWKRFSMAFFIMIACLYPYLYYVMTLKFGNYLIPLVVILGLAYISRRLVLKTLSHDYWSTMGLPDIRDFAEENGLN